MLEIVEVRTRKQRKEFVEYPLRLYKGNPYFVPPLYGDEMAMFTDKNIYKKTCDSVFYLAVKDGKTVGRIQGRDIRLEEGGMFTEHGYMVMTDDMDTYFDSSADEIPEEFCL